MYERVTTTHDGQHQKPSDVAQRLIRRMWFIVGERPMVSARLFDEVDMQLILEEARMVTVKVGNPLEKSMRKKSLLQLLSTSRSPPPAGGGVLFSSQCHFFA